MWETEEGLDFLASETLKARYLLEGEKDWNDICERVAKAIAITEEEYLEFKDLIIKKIFLPSSPRIPERRSLAFGGRIGHGIFS